MCKISLQSLFVWLWNLLLPFLHAFISRSADWSFCTFRYTYYMYIHYTYEHRNTFTTVHWRDNSALKQSIITRFVASSGIPNKGAKICVLKFKEFNLFVAYTNVRSTDKWGDATVNSSTMLHWNISRNYVGIGDSSKRPAPSNFEKLPKLASLKHSLGLIFRELPKLVWSKTTLFEWLPNLFAKFNRIINTRAYPVPGIR